VSTEPGTLHAIARHLVLALQPLQNAVADLPAFRTFLYRLGWEAKSLPPEYTALAAKVDQALASLNALGETPEPAHVLALLEEVKGVYQGIKSITAAPDGVDAPEFLSEIGDRMFNLLLVDYLTAAFPGAYSSLLAVGIITQENVNEKPGRPGYLLSRFRWEEIPKILTDPLSILERMYGWGTDDLDFHRISGDLLGIFLALGWPAYIGQVDDDLGRDFMDRPDDILPRGEWELRLPVLLDNIGGEEVEVGLALLELPPQGTKAAGLILQPLLPAVIGTSFDLTEDLKLELRAGTNIVTTLGLLIRPGDVSVKFPLQPGTVLPDAGFGVTLHYAPPTPALLLGTPGQSRFELKGAATTFTIDVHNGQLELKFEAAPQELKLVIAPGDLDGFLGQLLGKGERAIPMELGLRWSNSAGFSFLGGTGIEFSTQPHLTIGPLRIDQLSLAIKSTVGSGQPPNLTVEAGTAIGGNLGPISFSADGLGLKLALAFSEGNAGPFDVQFGFKPPNGIGLEIGGGGIVGGGFAKYDPEKEEYSGGLELVFQDTISVRALAILSTRMPDGSKDFSLLIIIDAEFEPIQLSFGFTLLGIGGLLGLNRTAAVEQLHTGIRDGSLQSILFPVDIVANAPRILSDLGRVFPAQPGVFLVGPMAKLGWGTPAIVTLELGIILELPRPTFAIIGVLRAALPVDEEPLVVLQVGFVGTIDFASGQLEFDASLFDSHVLSFTLSGDMAVRVYWKENANLLLSVGGFHPAYTPPPMNLRPMQRLAIVLFPDNPHVRAEAYLAITSNTLQVGARIEVSYDLELFNIYGFLSFDVLIQRSPFHFIADIAAMVAVRSGSHVLFSIQLQLTLEGPVPLHAHGTGSFEIGFSFFSITISASFDITIDTGALLAALTPIDVLSLLIGALGDPQNWRALLPVGRSSSVAVRKLPDSDGTLVLQPAGTLEISQKILPLNVAVQRLGGAAPDTAGAFTIKAVNFGNGTAPPVSPILEEFPPAQFFDMSDAEKLSRPSFAQYDAGVAIGEEIEPKTDYMQSRDVSYEVIYVPEHQPTPRFQIPGLLSGFSRAGSAVSNSPLSRSRTAPSPLSASAAVLVDRYAVVSTEDLSLHEAGAFFDTATSADQVLQGLVAQNPELSGKLQVMPAATVPTLELRP
jgi:hypothetical protein